MEIRRYESSFKEEWNSFIRDSRNGTFILDRDFMEYHSDRFADHSLLFYDGSKLVAAMPANIKDNTLYSHLGLTYGGIIQSKQTTIGQIREVVDLLVDHMKAEQITKLVYKPIPHIYHNYPTEEDLYALFHAGAMLSRRSISSTIVSGQRKEFNRLRKRHIKKARDLGFETSESNRLDDFWIVLENNLKETHGAKPVHSIDEIKLLHSRFPEQIRIFIAEFNNEVIAGMVIFETSQVVHVQYSSANAFGKQNGALDLLYNYVINEVFLPEKYFDFGTSTEDEGRFLNEGLIFQKEGFGGRGIVYDTYELTL